MYWQAVFWFLRYICVSIKKEEKSHFHSVRVSAKHMVAMSHRHIHAIFKSALTHLHLGVHVRTGSVSYLSKDWVDDGSQLPPVSLLQPDVIGVSHGGRQTQSLGLRLWRPLDTSWAPPPEWLYLLLDGALEDDWNRKVVPRKLNRNILNSVPFQDLKVDVQKLQPHRKTNSTHTQLHSHQ